MPAPSDDHEHLRRVLDDLEQQADGLHLAERDALVGEQRPGEYAVVALEDRLHGSTGARLRVEVLGLGRVEGVLERVGEGWFLLVAAPGTWVLRTPAVTSLRGLTDRAVASDDRQVTARLGLGSALRGLAAARGEVRLHRVDGTTLAGVLGRVGSDFVEVRSGDVQESVELVPFAALAAVRAA